MLPDSIWLYLIYPIALSLTNYENHWRLHAKAQKYSKRKKFTIFFMMKTFTFSYILSGLQPQLEQFNELVGQKTGNANDYISIMSSYSAPSEYQQKLLRAIK